MHVWCHDASVAFKRATSETRCTILTSGTLSPLKTFSAELGTRFPLTTQLPHVISSRSQLFAACVGTAPDCYTELSLTYKTAASLPMQDELGRSVAQLAAASPAGVVVFFPSYRLLNQLYSRWEATGVMNAIRSTKSSVFIEPSGNSSNNGGNSKGHNWSRSGGLIGVDVDVVDGGEVVVDEEDVGHALEKSERGGGDGGGGVVGVIAEYRAAIVADAVRGAVLFAVCRGKVSEGIDFADDQARTVILVGIPYPSLTDLEVRQKKAFNDRMCATMTAANMNGARVMMSGAQWYDVQAYRALNQAAGRCIRHRGDYGAVILLDARFAYSERRACLSKWICNVMPHGSLNAREAVTKLQSFFKTAAELHGKATTESCSSRLETSVNNNSCALGAAARSNSKNPTQDGTHSTRT